MVLTQLVFFPAVVTNAADDTYYDGILNASDTYFINPTWDTASLTAGDEIAIWFRGKERTLMYDAAKHFSSYADLYAAVYESDMVTVDNYITFKPTFIFAPGTYTENIHIPTAATVLGPQAGISPNAELSDSDKTVAGVEKNSGWAANPDRDGTTNEAVFTNKIDFTSRCLDSSGYYEYQTDLAYKYGWLREKAHSLDKTFELKGVVDGVKVTGHHSSRGAFQLSDYDRNKVLTYVSTDPMTATAGKNTTLVLKNVINASTGEFARGWNSSYSYYNIEVYNLRSTAAQTAGAFFNGYLDSLHVEDSFITNMGSTMTNSWSYSVAQRNLDPKITVTGSIFYNNPTSTSTVAGALFTLDPRSKKKLTVDVTDNIFYNAFDHANGLVNIGNQTSGTVNIDITDNIIHHTRTSQTTLITFGTVAGGTNIVNFNKNKVTGVITKLVNDLSAISANYLTVNFNYNFLGTTVDSKGICPTFKMSGASLDETFDWENPIYYSDYALTKLGVVDYDSLLTEDNTYFINPEWDTSSLTAGDEITIWFRGKDRTLKYDATKHFSSYADLYTAVYESDMVTIDNYMTFNPTFVFAPGTYTENIHIPTAATVLGPQAGIDPNAKLSDSDKTVAGVEKNGGWKANPDRNGTDNEAVFSNRIEFTTRSDGDNSGYYDDQTDLAYKYGWLREKAHSLDATFELRGVVDGVKVTGYTKNVGAFQLSDFDRNKVLTYDPDDTQKTIAGKNSTLVLKNVINDSTGEFVRGWNSSYCYYNVEIYNVRSTAVQTAGGFINGYLDSMRIESSFISNIGSTLTNPWSMANGQRNLDPEIIVKDSIFYNNSTSKTGTPGPLFIFDTISKKNVVVDISDNIFYNASDHANGLVTVKNTKPGTTSVNITNNIIHHTRSGQTTLITLSDITGGKNTVKFNNNKVTGVITNLVNDLSAINASYLTVNFNYNFLGATSEAEGICPTFKMSGESLDTTFDWENPIFYADYELTTLGVADPRGISFTNQTNVTATKKLTAVPHTYEAWVKVPKGMTSSVGNILSNYAHGTHSYISFEILANGVPRVRWFDTLGVQYETEFKNVNMSNGRWTHLAITVDPQSGIAKCYINGEYADTRYYYPEIDSHAINNPFVIGGNHSRQLNDYYFKAKLSGIDLYADVRSADEIKSDYENGADLLDKNLLASYDLSAKSTTGIYEDKSANAAYAVDGQLWMTEEEMEIVRGNVFDEDFERKYNLVVVGDTQMSVQNDASANKTATQTLYKYIVDNIENFNTQYVIGVGDITDDDNVAQWDVAYDAITQMDGKIGYSLVRGNHDVINDATLDVTYFNQYFGDHEPYVSQFTGENGGMYEEGSVHNTWTTFKMGDVDYLMINIDWLMTDGVLDWANEVISSHPDHKVIISTHSYIYYDGIHVNDTLGQGNSSYGNAASGTYNNGDDLWKEVVSQHENVELVLCGHVMSERIDVQQRKGKNGNTVTEVLVNQQGIDNISNPHKGLGFVTNFFFNEEQNKIEVEVYSTVLKKYYRPQNQLVIDLTVEGEDHVCDFSADKPEGMGTKDEPYLVSNGDHLLWIASQTLAGSTASLDGVYFKQTQDIDLRGQYIRQIGVSFTSDSSMQAFGGIYDGNGFVIKNGIVAPSKANNSDNRSFGYGLFGVIYGAEIKNVTLENMTVMGRGVSGMIVGRACAPLDGSAKSGFNKITNCIVKSDCSFPVQSPSWRTPAPSYDTTSHTGVTGSIIGMAHATEISYCESSLTMNLPGLMASSGGIAGTVGYNSSVDHCIFDGAINVVDNSAKCTNNLGGIVGYISPSKNAAVSGITDAMKATPVSITNCVNKADITYTGTAATPQNLCIGGILGGHGWQVGFESELEYPHLMENCYNLGNIDAGEIHATSTKIWIGGLVGKGLCTADSTQIEMWMKDCASVDVDERDNGAGVGTNEYRNEDKKNVDGYYGVEPVGDTVKTLTAEQMQSVVTDIVSESELHRHAVTHTVNRVDAKEPTCTEIGWNEYYACDDCDYTYGYEVIPAGHNLVDVEAKDATCFEDGYTAHTACTVCDYTEGYEVIPAGHKWGDYVYNEDATVMEDGTKTRTCGLCGETETVTAEGTKLPIQNVPDERLPKVELNEAGNGVNLDMLGSWATRVYWGYIGTEEIPYKWFDDFRLGCGTDYNADFAPRAESKYYFTKKGYYRFVLKCIVSGDSVENYEYKDMVYTFYYDGNAKPEVPYLKIVDGNTVEVEKNGLAVTKMYYGNIGDTNVPYGWFNDFWGKALATKSYKVDFGVTYGEQYKLTTKGFYNFVIVYEDAEKVTHEIVYTVEAKENIGIITAENGNATANVDNVGGTVNKLYWGYIGEDAEGVVNYDTLKAACGGSLTGDWTVKTGDTYTLDKTGYYGFCVNYTMESFINGGFTNVTYDIIYIVENN